MARVGAVGGIGTYPHRKPQTPNASSWWLDRYDCFNLFSSWASYIYIYIYIYIYDRR